MVSRSNQLKKKASLTNEHKLPDSISEDIKDLFTEYDQDGLGYIQLPQAKAILNYIISGSSKKFNLEAFLFEITQKSMNFDMLDIDKAVSKLWEDAGKEQYQKEVNNILKSLQPYNSNEELEAALKSKLSK